MSKFVRGTAQLTLASLFFFGTGYLLQILLGRYLTPDEYGNFGVVISTLNVLLGLAISGFHQAVVKFVAELGEEVGGFLRFSLKLAGIGGLAFTLSILVLARPLAVHVFHDPSLVMPLMLISLFFPFYLLRAVTRGLLLGRRQFLSASFISVSSAATKLVAVGAVILLGFRLIGVLVGYLMAPVVGLIFGVGLLYKHGYHSLRGTKGQSFNKNRFLKWGMLLTVVSFALPFFKDLSLYVIKYLEVQPERVGYYNAALTLSSISTVLGTGLTGSILPVISDSARRGRINVARDQVVDALRYITLFLSPIVVSLVVSARSVIRIVFPPEYVVGYQALQLLLIGLFFFTLYSLLNSILIGLGMARQLVEGSLVAITIGLFLLWFFVPVWGINGAALAAAISFFFAFVIMLVFVGRRLALAWSQVWVYKIVLACLVVGEVFSYGLGRIDEINLLELGFMYLLFVVAYAFVLYVLGEVRQKDLVLLKSLIPFWRS